MKKAIILAAGQSKRLRPLTNSLPKTLLKVGNTPILERQLKILEDHGIKDIYIVTGFMEEQIRDYVGERAKFFHNAKFIDTNVLYSLACAKEAFDGGFYFLHADTLFDPMILKELIEHKGDLVLPVDFKGCCEEEMKVVTDEKGKIHKINKTMNPNEAHGEFIGLAKVGPKVIHHLKEHMEKILPEREKEAFFE